MNNTTSKLAEVAASFVLRGATEYLQCHKLTADPGALAACCRDWARIKLPEALRDAKDALDCHMGNAAEQTFALSMMAAGIEAAKECGLPKYCGQCEGNIDALYLSPKGNPVCRTCAEKNGGL